MQNNDHEGLMCKTYEPQTRSIGIMIRAVSLTKARDCYVKMQ